jgi:lipopolysaccharide/colanic/teichoic acid biosynthesis glycosyltransferase
VERVNDLAHNRVSSEQRNAGLPSAMARRSAKRSIDVVGAVFLILLTAPLWLLAALAVRMSSPGPVFFRQRRVAHHGRIITLIKFRTFPVSHVDSAWSLAYADCPLRAGRFLRRTSIDELPQLINVIRGELSLVGPRPERVHFDGELGESVPGYTGRHRVPGGITGLAQVNGYWGQTSIHERVRLDNVYIEEWSLRGDLVILARTALEVVRRAVHPTAQSEADVAANAITANAVDPCSPAERWDHPGWADQAVTGDQPSFAGVRRLFARA